MSDSSIQLSIIEKELEEINSICSASTILLNELVSTTKDLAGQVEGVGEGVAMLSAESSEIADEVTILIGAIEGVFADVVTNVQEDVVSTLGEMQNMLEVANGKVKEVNEDVRNNVETVQNLGRSCLDLTSDSTEALSGLQSEVQDVLETADELASSLIAALAEGFETLSEDVSEIVETKTDELIEFLQTPIRESMDVISSFTDQMVAQFENTFLSGIEDLVSTSIEESLAEKIDILKEMVVEEVESLVEKLTERSDVADGEKAALQDSIDLFEAAMDPVMSVLDNFRSLASSVGVSI